MLRDWGIDWRVIDGPIGAASGLKMSYAGITKGTTAIASAMMLGAARFGCAEALIAELSESQPEMLSSSATASRGCTTRPIAGSPRWRRSPISSAPTSRRADIYAAIARLYDFLAADEADAGGGSPDNAIKSLDKVLGRPV